MDSPITRAEHEEFRKRISSELGRLADEDARQNKRLDALELLVNEIHAISTAVERLAINVESLTKELKRQGDRLSSLEHRDGENWRKLVGYAGTALVGGLVGYLLKQLGIF